jgi:hypothetical protein
MSKAQREANLAYQRAWRAKNREKIRAQRKALRAHLGNAARRGKLRIAPKLLAGPWQGPRLGGYRYLRHTVESAPVAAWLIGNSWR